MMKKEINSSMKKAFYGLYNPQNEAFLHSRTSRAISQNETYRRNTPYPPLKNRPAYAGIHIL